MTKNSSFSCFLAIFMSYFPLFLRSKRICKACKSRYMLDRYDQKFVVFAFYDRFHEYFPLFWGSGRFTTTVRFDTCGRDMTQSSHFMAVFMSYCPVFYGSKAIYINLKI